MGVPVADGILITVLGGRRITLPKAFCERNEVVEGSQILVKEDGCHLHLVPVTVKVIERQVGS